MVDELEVGRRGRLLFGARLALLVVLVAVARPVEAVERALLYAQSSSVFDEQDLDDSSSLFDADSILAKSLIVVGVFLVAFLFLFFVLYGILVDSARWWPLSAYGLTAGLVVLLTVAAGLWSFWDDLVINREGSTAEGGFSWFDKMGLRATVAFGGILAFVFLTYVFKSQRGRVAAR